MSLRQRHSDSDFVLVDEHVGDSVPDGKLATGLRTDKEPLLHLDLQAEMELLTVQLDNDI